jgi:hypothetical protein
VVRLTPMKQKFPFCLSNNAGRLTKDPLRSAVAGFFSLATITSTNRCYPSYSRTMFWAHASILFGFACLWAVTLFVVFREPAA